MPKWSRTPCGVDTPTLGAGPGVASFNCPCKDSGVVQLRSTNLIDTDCLGCLRRSASACNPVAQPPVGLGKIPLPDLCLFSNSDDIILGILVALIVQPQASSIVESWLPVSIPECLDPWKDLDGRGRCVVQSRVHRAAWLWNCL
ncbi:hypothetical protein N658DRAFT_502393 [Parathielavia hyrcaniae]|uniref:Uncharacterized protein n=1 Tax=Parathielavia hyrcaniae TaxID=113614 RepID=A0AAN6SWA9_9PEZI|nr:hypothetical protein N658DRAFT_502397 [Parathielavia hyrcaniae]KAK4095728.1 hypothetical protein N658DRAFT_502393 [Parathielavia hyrcaniae]